MLPLGLLYSLMCGLNSETAALSQKQLLILMFATSNRGDSVQHMGGGKDLSVTKIPSSVNQG